MFFLRYVRAEIYPGCSIGSSRARGLVLRQNSLTLLFLLGVLINEGVEGAGPLRAVRSENRANVVVACSCVDNFSVGALEWTYYFFGKFLRLVLPNCRLLPHVTQLAPAAGDCVFFGLLVTF